MRRSIALLVLGVTSVACSGSTAPPARRLLVVGWDGASFDMIDPLLAEGRLPNVARLLERGTSARFRSTIVPISSAAWVSAVTGKTPGHTGVYDFFEPVTDTYDVALISSRSNRAAPLWRILTRRGVRSLVFGVPTTYPPEPILGTMVTGMLSPYRATFTHPPELAEKLRARGFLPSLGSWREVRDSGPVEVTAQLDLKEEVLLEQLGGDWRFAMIVFKSLDFVAHRSHEGDFAATMATLYVRLDEILGRLIEAAGEDTNVLLVSDHGFTVYPTGFNLHAWLLDSGYSVRKERVKGFQISANEPNERQERQHILRLRNELDWPATRAFAVSCRANFGSVRLNVEGREPKGCVAPDEVEATLDELERGLRALRIEPDGPPLVTNVWRSGELYAGPLGDTLPDLLFEVDASVQVFTDVDEKRVAAAFQVPVPDHARTGILVAAGPDIPHVPRRGDADIQDLAPTALCLLSQPVYAEMQGRVLFGGDPERISEADDPAVQRAPESSSSPFTPEQLDDLLRRLEALGYVR